MVSNWEALQGVNPDYPELAQWLPKAQGKERALRQAMSSAAGQAVVDAYVDSGHLQKQYDSYEPYAASWSFRKSAALFGHDLVSIKFGPWVEEWVGCCPPVEFFKLQLKPFGDTRKLEDYANANQCAVNPTADYPNIAITCPFSKL